MKRSSAERMRSWGGWGEWLALIVAPVVSLVWGMCESGMEPWVAFTVAAVALVAKVFSSYGDRQVRRLAPDVVTNALGEDRCYVHYAVGGLGARADTEGTRITAIAAKFVFGGGAKATLGFRMTLSNLVPLDEAEVLLIEGFADWIEKRPSAKFIVWNMRDNKFGFPAIERRLELLSRPRRVWSVGPERLIDIARLLWESYGNFAPHPRLFGLGSVNGLDDRHMVDFDQEAALFGEGRFAEIEESVAAKVERIEQFHTLWAQRRLAVCHDES